MPEQPSQEPAGDHYFTARPAALDERRPLDVTLAGRTVQVQTAPGVFSHQQVDLGTRVLLREVPDPPRHGDLLDLGCGWGPLAISMALRAPEATVWAVDVNERALDLLRDTASRLGLSGVRAVLPDHVPDDVAFAAIWSNPPIRVGKAALHDLLDRWLPRLDNGGQAHLVVQRHLGADSLASWLADRLSPGLAVDRLGSAKGFRVLRVARR